MDREQGHPLRVAQIMGKLCAGGVESVIFNYYRHMDHGKIQFDFYVDDDSTVPVPQDILDAGAGCYVIPRYQHLPQNMVALYRHFEQEKYAVVHSNLNTLSVFPLCAAWLARVPVRIAHSHSTAGKGETGKNILKYILRPFAKMFATDYFACTAHAGRWLFGKKAMEQGRVRIINNAIDMDRFKYNEDVRNEVRKELGLEGKFVVGHVGRFCYQKNQDLVLDIFREVCKHNDRCALVFVGDGEDKAKIEKRAREMEGTVLFLGNRTDVYRLYQAMDVFVFPSRYEGLGMAAIEAQACGLRVIASTAIPADACLSGKIQFLPLEAGAELWARLVQDKPTDKGDYDIEIQASRLSEYYDMACEKKRS